MERRDRLAELQRDKTLRTPTPSSNNGTNDPTRPPQGVEMRPLLAGNSDQNATNQFLNNVAALNDEIRSLQNTALPQISKLQSKLDAAVDEAESNRVRTEIDSVSDDTKKTVYAIKAKVSALEPSPRDPDFGIRKNQYSGLTTNFMNLLSNYRTAEIELQRRQASMLERQYRIVNPSATEEEINQAVSNAEAGRPIFAQSLIQSMERRGQAERTLENVRARGEDVRKLAKTIEELTSLFRDMQQLVEQQSKLIEQIEVHTEQTVTDLEAGNEYLGSGIKSAKSLRRNKWICFGISIIIIIIVVVVVLFKLGVFEPKPPSIDNTTTTSTSTVFTSAIPTET